MTARRGERNNRAADDPLVDSRARRDFRKTPEPRGIVARLTALEGSGFVIPRHAARRLHFDFRLKLGGVLKSWALTRGPSLDPTDKGLAVRTEDHPLSYAEFEGVIPAPCCGAGSVMIWDQGLWFPVDADVDAALLRGRLRFTLQGQRLQGGWILVRLNSGATDERENWLLRKLGDEHAADGEDRAGREMVSVRSGRTMAQIAGRAGSPGVGESGVDALPAFRPVQLATPAEVIPDTPGWMHEIKPACSMDGAHPWRSSPSISFAIRRTIWRSGPTSSARSGCRRCLRALLLRCTWPAMWSGLANSR